MKIEKKLRRSLRKNFEWALNILSENFLLRENFVLSGDLCERLTKLIVNNRFN